jgi:hypothetical protein
MLLVLAFPVTEILPTAWNLTPKRSFSFLTNSEASQVVILLKNLLWENSAFASKNIDKAFKNIFAFKNIKAKNID